DAGPQANGTPTGHVCYARPRMRSALASLLLAIARLALLALLPLALVACAAETRARPKAVHGGIDLRDWDFRRGGPAKLGGEWELYWAQLPGEAPLAQTGYFTVPAQWEGHTLPDGTTLGGFGHATLRLQVLLPERAATEPPGALSVATDVVTTAYTLSVRDEG